MYYCQDLRRPAHSLLAYDQIPPGDPPPPQGGGDSPRLGTTALKAYVSFLNSQLSIR